MSVDSSNIINAPVEITDVESVLGDTEYSVYKACLSPSVNRWSRYKPIALPTDDLNFHFRGNYTNERHGLYIKVSGNLTAFARRFVDDSGSVVKFITTLPDWQRDMRKTGGLGNDNLGKRLGDFDGYYDDATPPVGGFYCPPELSTNANVLGPNQPAYLLDALTSTVGDDSPTSPGSIRLSQILMAERPDAIVAAQCTLADCYFGVMLVRAVASDADKVAWVKTAPAKGSTTSDIKSTGQVDMTLNDSGTAMIPNGNYLAVPFLSQNPITGKSSASGRICLVPNCIPVRVHVNSGTDAAPIQLAITHCIFQAPVGSTGTTKGQVKVTLTVKNASSNSRACQYTITSRVGTAAAKTELLDMGIDMPAKTTKTKTEQFEATYADALKMEVTVTLKYKDASTNVDRTVTATSSVIVAGSAITENPIS